MQYINLRELYPDVYKSDTLVEVTEEVLDVIQASDRAEAAYKRRMYRYKAQYSLDCNNGIEKVVRTSSTGGRMSWTMTRTTSRTSISPTKLASNLKGRR